MSWGDFYFYYRCPNCKKLYKYSLSDLNKYGIDFGKCPVCDTDGELLREGAMIENDSDYEEI